MLVTKVVSGCPQFWAAASRPIWPMRSFPGNSDFELHLPVRSIPKLRHSSCLRPGVWLVGCWTNRQCPKPGFPQLSTLRPFWDGLQRVCVCVLAPNLGWWLVPSSIRLKMDPKLKRRGGTLVCLVARPPAWWSGIVVFLLHVSAVLLLP